MDNDGYRVMVGKRVRAWRVLHDLSQDDLAEKAGVTRNFVSAIERGAQGLDASRLRRLAGVMGVPIGTLLAEPEDGVQADVMQTGDGYASSGRAADQTRSKLST